jgi:hypothetical protein
MEITCLNTATEPDVDVVDAIQVDDHEVLVGHNRIGTRVAAMSKLHAEAEVAESHFVEKFTSPYLEKSLRTSRGTIHNATYLDSMQWQLQISVSVDNA